MCMVVLNEFVQTWNYKIFYEKLCPSSLPLVLIYPRSVAWSTVRPFTQNIYTFFFQLPWLLFWMNLDCGHFAVVWSLSSLPKYTAQIVKRVVIHCHHTCYPSFLRQSSSYESRTCNWHKNWHLFFHSVYEQEPELRLSEQQDSGEKVPT